MFGKQSKITLMILGLCLLSFLIIGIGVFLWQQQAVKTTEIKNETAQLVTKKKEIEDKLGPNDKNIELEDANLKKKKKSLEILQKTLMDYQYIPKFLDYIQQVAQETDNELISIGPGEAKPIDFNNPLFKPAPKPGADGVVPPAAPPSVVPKDPKKQYKTMPITITMKGTYVSSVKFIDSLRKFKQIIYIRNLTLSPNDINGKVVVNSIITASALIVPEQYINSEKMRAEKAKDGKPTDDTTKKIDPAGNATDKTKLDKKPTPPGTVVAPDKKGGPVQPAGKAVTDKSPKPIKAKDETVVPEKATDKKSTVVKPGGAKR
jgi:Tfp pilus assembly protein PilO